MLVLEENLPDGDNSNFTVKLMLPLNNLGMTFTQCIVQLGQSQNSAQLNYTVIGILIHMHVHIYLAVF